MRFPPFRILFKRLVLLEITFRIGHYPLNFILSSFPLSLVIKIVRKTNILQGSNNVDKRYNTAMIDVFRWSVLFRARYTTDSSCNLKHLHHSTILLAFVWINVQNLTLTSLWFTWEMRGLTLDFRPRIAVLKKGTFFFFFFKDGPRKTP